MKKILILIVMLALFAGSLWAQMEMTGWASPQNSATQGRYRSAADNFIRPDVYSGVSFDKFFAMTSFAASNRAQLGYATKIGGAYLAAAYGGKFWGDYTALDYTERKLSWAGGSDKTVPVYDSINFNTNTPENRIAILLGIADMGFRLTFSSTQESISLDEFATGVAGSETFYKSYEAARGAITPQLAWSMAKDLSDSGIRPYVAVDLGFIQNYRKQDQYDTDATAFNGVRVASSANYIEPIVYVGLGGYTFYKNDSNFRASADLDYALTMRFYDSEYSYLDSNGKYKISSISGMNTNGTLTENTYNSHLITPSVSGQWSGGPLALRFKFNLPVTLRSETRTGMAVDNDKLVKNGSDETRFYIGFAPNLRLAAQWKIMSKLTLNAGGRINLGGNLARETIEADVYSNDTKSHSIKGIDETIGSTSNQLTAGVTFLPVDKVTFEASCGIGNNNAISVFDAGGLFYFTNFLVSLRY